MARIDRGIVDDGSSGLSVAGGVSIGAGLAVGGAIAVGGANAGALPLAATLANGANTVLTTPGFYKYSGGTTGAASQCTGTLPAADAYPGAQFVFTPVIGTGGGMLLTGSVPTGAASIFSLSSGSFAVADGGTVLAAGGKLTLPNSGSMIVQSNGLTWMHVASTGVFKLLT